MKQLILLFVLVLFISGCGGCPENQTYVGDKCCADLNENFICDLDELQNNANKSSNNTDNATNSTDANADIQDVTGDAAFNATNTTSIPVIIDCEHTELTVGRVIYYDDDGENSKVFAVMSNYGLVNVTAFKMRVYDDDGKAVEKIFDLGINASQTKELIFEYEGEDLVNANNSANLIMFLPEISTGKYCDTWIEIWDFTSIDR
jgi:hypothetical protein